jgi:hypothetical protein
MASRRRKRNALGALVIALLFLGLAVGLYLFLPRISGPARATQIPTPGQVTLPPTAPAIATATAR